MAKVKLINLNKRYGDKTIIHDLNLSIRDKEFLVLVGPSGCGKSTTIRLIAGLEKVTGGDIMVDDKIINDIPSKNRDMAMVFQNYALYPHMNVYKNIAFSLQLRGMPKNEIDERVKKTAALLNITELLYKKPGQMSGGQKQRVALGRAIVRNPKVFLMDEPLSNLDAKLRVQTRAEIKKLHKKLGVTIIYVTHDQIEAMTMGDRMAVLKDGWLQQLDTPLNIYNHPANIFVAGFIGSPAMNFIKAVLNKIDGKIYAKSDWFNLIVKRTGIDEKYINKEIMLGIRPEHIAHISCAAINDNIDECTFSLRVNMLEPTGNKILAYLERGQNNLIASISSKAEINIDDETKFAIDSAQIHLFDLKTQKSILN